MRCSQAYEWLICLIYATSNEFSLSGRNAFLMFPDSLRESRSRRRICPSAGHTRGAVTFLAGNRPGMRWTWDRPAVAAGPARGWSRSAASRGRGGRVPGETHRSVSRRLVYPAGGRGPQWDSRHERSRDAPRSGFLTQPCSAPESEEGPDSAHGHTATAPPLPGEGAGTHASRRGPRPIRRRCLRGTVVGHPGQFLQEPPAARTGFAERIPPPQPRRPPASPQVPPPARRAGHSRSPSPDPAASAAEAGICSHVPSRGPASPVTSALTLL